MSCTAGKLTATSERSSIESVPFARLSKPTHSNVSPLDVVKTSPGAQDVTGRSLRAKSLTPVIIFASMAPSRSTSVAGVSLSQTIRPFCAAHHLPETKFPTSGSSSSAHLHAEPFHSSFLPSVHVSGVERACSLIVSPPIAIDSSTARPLERVTSPEFSITRLSIHPLASAKGCFFPVKSRAKTLPSMAHAACLLFKFLISAICASCFAFPVPPWLPPESVKKRCCASTACAENTIKPIVSSLSSLDI